MDLDELYAMWEDFYCRALRVPPNPYDIEVDL